MTYELWLILSSNRYLYNILLNLCCRFFGLVLHNILNNCGLATASWFKIVVVGKLLHDSCNIFFVL